MNPQKVPVMGNVGSVKTASTSLSREALNRYENFIKDREEIEINIGVATQLSNWCTKAAALSSSTNTKDQFDLLDEIFDGSAEGTDIYSQWGFRIAIAALTSHSDIKKTEVAIRCLIDEISNGAEEKALEVAKNKYANQKK